MTADQFTAAQQAANVAYDMTLYETGSGEQAADAYNAVMTAFYDALEARGHDGWISNTARLADDVPMPDPQAMTHAATIRRANVDDRFFAALLNDDGYGMMGDTD